jgi:hypothetical protein
MLTWLASLPAVAHRADFWSRLCFIGLSAIVATCSAYGFFTAYDVWAGFTVASAGGVALAALCAISQFCSLNLSHQARRREGRDRALCLVLMVVCGGWSAYGLHHFWDVVQLAAAEASGQVYVPVRRLEDIDGPAALMMTICVAIAFVEPLTFWVLGGTPAPRQEQPSNVEQFDPARRRAGRRASALAATAIALGAVPLALPHEASGAHPEPVQSASRPSRAATRDIAFADVERVSDRLQRDGARVSLRRIAAELGTSKSKIERVLSTARVSIADRWPPAVAA